MRKLWLIQWGGIILTQFLDQTIGILTLTGDNVRRKVLVRGCDAQTHTHKELVLHGRVILIQKSVKKLTLIVQLEQRMK